MSLHDYQAKMNLLASLRNTATSIREDIAKEKHHDIREMLKVNLDGVEREMKQVSNELNAKK